MIDIPELVSEIIHFVPKIDLLTKTKLINKTFNSQTNYELSKRLSPWEKSFKDFTSLRPMTSQWSFSSFNRYYIDYKTGLYFHLTIIHNGSNSTYTIEMSHLFGLEKSINLYSVSSPNYYQFYLTEIPGRLSKSGCDVKLMIFQKAPNDGISIDYTNLNNIVKTWFDCDIPRQLLFLMCYQKSFWEKNQVYQKYLGFNTFRLSEEFEDDYDFSHHFCHRIENDQAFVLFGVPNHLRLYRSNGNEIKEYCDIPYEYNVRSSQAINFINAPVVGILTRSNQNEVRMLLFDFKKAKIVYHFRLFESIRTYDCSYLLFYQNQPILVIISMDAFYIISESKNEMIPFVRSLNDLVYFDESICFVFIKNRYNQISKSINVIRLLDLMFHSNPQIDEKIK